MNSVMDILISLRDSFNSHIIFGVALLLLVGYLFGKVAEKLRLPTITGYLLAGLFLGGSFTGIINHEMGNTLRAITEIALGIIAITIGSEFSADTVRRLGMKILVITLVQFITTFIVVTVCLYIFRLPLRFALILGAIATATAPAATVIIIQTLRAKGDFVNTLYGVVALDDAFCVLLFACIFAFAGPFFGMNIAEHSGIQMLWHAISEIGISIFIGLMGGVLLHLVIARNTNPKEIMIISLGFISLITTVSISLNVSSLLANMAAGAVLINTSTKNIKVFRNIAPLTPPLYAMFFAIAGTELQLAVLKTGTVLILGTVYVVSRAIGKYGGAWLGAGIVRTDPKTRRYLGLTLIPQAGVAIGLVLFIQTAPFVTNATDSIKVILEQMVNIVLFSVLVNELIGPPLSKFGLIRGADL
ncbi:MAG TPA: hypothetical protein ENN07_06220 [candidate division Zixibacteria bacterium]|mgnify:CR=1 FL=1|nr:hypothetical protein [candidate division Zixibacteria bacterium]